MVGTGTGSERPSLAPLCASSDSPGCKFPTNELSMVERVPKLFSGSGGCRVSGEGRSPVQRDSGEVGNVEGVAVGGISSVDEFTPSDGSTVAEFSAACNTCCTTSTFGDRIYPGENEEDRPWTELRDKYLTWGQIDRPT